MPCGLLGVLRYQGLQLALGPVTVERGRPGQPVKIGKLCPGVGAAHVDGSDPHVLGMHIDGGFLSGQIIRFSPNLNCIVGGRGTGKSTAFEGVRCLVGDTSTNGVVDSEVWPDELHLLWQDKAGQQHTLMRAKDGDLQNLDDPATGASTLAPGRSMPKR